MISHRKKLEIKCLGYYDFQTGKVYKYKETMLAAKAKRTIVLKAKRLFNLAFMRKMLIEAKIAYLKLKRFTWDISCQIASLKNELKAMLKGYSLTCVSFLKLGFSDRKKLYNV